ncbi:unnamed protein product [Tuber aestivum]|uniref:HTH myb-type domain-containing protein n=1 Tax=Tuber aestivum TaxID=59557 RepID=A0A292Q602_9PEZI|nr:unnamed protein product [Tuber aestivum]
MSEPTSDIQQPPNNGHNEDHSLPNDSAGGFSAINRLDNSQDAVDPALQTPLQAVAAFNAAFPDIDPSPNRWGKRQADTEIPEDAMDDIAAKRQQMEDLAAVSQTLSSHLVQADLSQDEVNGQNLSMANFAGGSDAVSQYAPQPHTPVVQNDHQNVLTHETEDDGMDQDFMSDEEQEGNSGPASWDQYDHNSFLMWDANRNLRIHSLPILDNLSSQILSTLGKGPYQETLNIVTQPESDQGQAYNTMKTLFDHTKKLYTHEAFLSADELKFEQPEQRATIRRVNLATFVSSVFGSQEVGFFHLNEHFLDTFVPDGGRLLKSQGALYLDLKTQAYISAMSTNERDKEDILLDLFPDDMSSILLNRKPGAKQLTPSELDFAHRLAQRKQHLMMIPDDVNLSEKYVWQEFLKEVSWYVSKNYESIVAQPVSSNSLLSPQGNIRRVRKRKSPSLSNVRTPTFGHAGSPLAGRRSMSHGPEDMNGSPLARSESRTPNGGEVSVAQLALENELFGSNTSIAMSLGAPPSQPSPPQSAPTQVLYERARMAATAKASPNSRRAGLPSQRRPWTTEEENALMAGLDRVKGPHWSQILAMFGAGGTVNEVLKDRNQVQLKDKARNLKLFFLKSNIEVPYYLQFVTGELKTRAPGQAAKHAAKKATAASASEDAAHVAAVTALGQARNMTHLSQAIDMDQVVAAAAAAAAAGGLGEGSSSQEGSHQGSVAPMADMGMGVDMTVTDQLQQHDQLPHHGTTAPNTPSAIHHHPDAAPSHEIPNTIVTHHQHDGRLDPVLMMSGVSAIETAPNTPQVVDGDLQN